MFFSQVVWRRQPDAVCERRACPHTDTSPRTRTTTTAIMADLHEPLMEGGDGGKYTLMQESGGGDTAVDIEDDDAPRGRAKTAMERLIQRTAENTAKTMGAYNASVLWLCGCVYLPACSSHIIRAQICAHVCMWGECTSVCIPNLLCVYVRVRRRCALVHCVSVGVLTLSFAFLQYLQYY